MNKKNNGKLLAAKAFKRYLKSVARRNAEKKRRNGFQKFLNLIKKQSQISNTVFVPPSYEREKRHRFSGQKPEYNDLIKFLIPKYRSFSDNSLPLYENGHLEVPRIFSLSENHAESMYFLKRLFNILYNETNTKVILDYHKCTTLDVDASACMDLILAGFITFYHRCQIKNHKVKVKEISPINITDPEVKNVLLSIGAYKNLTGFKLKKEEGFIPFTLRMGDSKTDKRGIQKEIDETEIVDYVIKCLGEVGQSLTPEAESHLSKVVGEVMANAEEHSDFRYRFAIGYFIKPNKAKDFGTFKLSIFNFGQTIYESFKKSECQDLEVVRQMKELSEDFTKKGFFKKAEYEEQTLWTLYALQEGVTCTRDWKRGKGTIRFIDRFFKLQGKPEDECLSKLTLISGNTQIIFDGSFPLIEVVKGKDNQSYQMMTFNESGNIHEKPNEKSVIFVPQYFPGTLITANICITSNNLEIKN